MSCECVYNTRQWFWHRLQKSVARGCSQLITSAVSCKFVWRSRHLPAYRLQILQKLQITDVWFLFVAHWKSDSNNLFTSRWNDISGVRTSKSAQFVDLCGWIFPWINLNIGRPVTSSLWQDVCPSIQNWEWQYLFQFATGCLMPQVQENIRDLIYLQDEAFPPPLP